jgi:ABC-type multidrug transport system ATPase subunit
MPSQSDGSRRHPDNAIQISGLTKRYKNGVLANDSIDLTVPRGVIFGLLGPNGAGKTTLVRQLTGELLPTSGSVNALGVDVIKDPLRAKTLLGVMPQQAQLFWNVAPQDNLRIFGRLHGLSASEARERTEEMLVALDLLPHRDKHSHQLSGGLQRKLMAGMAMIAATPILVLDEPTTGLDPRSRRELWSLISAARAKGVTVLLTTHYMDEAEELCSEVALIDRGRIIVRGTVEEVRSRCRNQYKATYQVSGDRRTVYGKTQEEVVEQVAHLDLSEYSFGHTSLEDIYLELTGKGLEEGAASASRSES